jgi:hypothetical protein
MSAYQGEPPCRTLRAEIKSLATPDTPDAPWDRRFYPSSKLRRKLTRNRVEEVLTCPCHSCIKRFEMRNPTHISKCCDDILAITKLDWFNGNDAVNLFALLIFIECPQFVIPFIQRISQREGFPKRLQDLEADFLTGKVWARFHEKHPEESRSLANDFFWQKFKFAVPYMQDEGYDEYTRDTILPFINERPLGRVIESGEVIQEGAFGKVYSFEILEEYRAFKVSSAEH